MAKAVLNQFKVLLRTKSLVWEPWNISIGGPCGQKGCKPHYLPEIHCMYFNVLFEVFPN